MKYLLTGVIGFVFGAAIALGLLYVDPFTQEAGPAPLDSDSVFSYGSPVTSGLVFTHGGRLRLPVRPDGVPDLWEATIDASALSVLVLRGADGSPAALASRVSYPDEETELLAHGALLNDQWLISVPGQGSILISSQSNWWPFLKESLIPVWYLRRPWAGPAVLTPTVGPAPGGLAVVQGASGSFAGRSGSGSERYQIEQFDSLVGPRQAYAEIAWRLDEPATETATD